MNSTVLVDISKWFLVNSGIQLEG